MSWQRVYKTGHNQARANFVERRKRNTSTVGGAKVEMERPRIAARRVAEARLAEGETRKGDRDEWRCKLVFA